MLGLKGMSRFRDIEGLLKIFTFDRKADLERYCRDVVVYQPDFVAFVLACDAGTLPLRHKIHFRDYVPQHLEPSESQREALGANGAGPYGALTYSGGVLYGMTNAGGDNGLGTIYAFSVPEPCTAALFGLGALVLLAYRWRRSRASRLSE